MLEAIDRLFSSRYIHRREVTARLQELCRVAGIEEEGSDETLMRRLAIKLVPKADELARLAALRTLGQQAAAQLRATGAEAIAPPQAGIADPQ